MFPTMPSRQGNRSGIRSRMIRSGVLCGSWSGCPERRHKEILPRTYYTTVQTPIGKPPPPSQWQERSHLSNCHRIINHNPIPEARAIFYKFKVNGVFLVGIVVSFAVEYIKPGVGIGAVNNGPICFSWYTDIGQLQAFNLRQGL
jgi:hypothetical protein